MPGGKNWTFTWNNYTDDTISHLRYLSQKPNSKISYIVFGREVGTANQTPHLQGTLLLHQRMTLMGVRALVQGAPHLEYCVKPYDSMMYCKKDGDFEEFGTKPDPNKKNKRHDLEDFKDAVKCGDIVTHKEARATFSLLWAKFENFCTQFLMDHVPPPLVTTIHPLRPWQTAVYLYLRRPVRGREIMFVVDLKGNAGKTWFQKYYRKNFPQLAQLILPCKKADMSYLLVPGKKTYIIDCPRSKQGEYIQYDFLEEIKNGEVNCPKYQSRIKSFAIPHVVVFMNEYPDMNKLSEDRYIVIDTDQANFDVITELQYETAVISLDVEYIPPTEDAIDDDTGTAANTETREMYNEAMLPTPLEPAVLDDINRIPTEIHITSDTSTPNSFDNVDPGDIENVSLAMTEE